MNGQNSNFQFYKKFSDARIKVWKEKKIQVFGDPDIQ
jgi:hypothetical protein